MVRSLIAFLFVTATAVAQPRADMDGDPLPDGALARFGSHRFRLGSYGSADTLALSPDGKTLATLQGVGLSLWDSDSGRKLRCLSEAGAPFIGLCFSPDGKTLVGLMDNQVKLLDPTTGEERRSIELENEARTIAFRPGTTEVVVSGAGQFVQTFDTAAATDPRVFKADESVRILSPSGRYFLGQSDSVLHLVDTESGRLRCRFRLRLDRELDDEVGNPAYQRCALSPDDRRLYLVSAHGELLVFDTRTGRRVERHDAPSGWTLAERQPRLALSPDGSLLYVAYPGAATRRRDLKARKWLDPLPAMPAGTLLPHPDGERLLFIDLHGVLRRYDLTTLREIRRPRGFDTNMLAAASPDGKRVAVTSGAEDGRLDVFDLTGRLLWSVPVRGQPEAPCWSADGRRVACTCDEQLVVCDAATGKVTHTLPSPNSDRKFMGLLGFNAAGDQLVASLDNGQSMATFSLIGGGRPVVVETGVEWSVDISPDGSVVAFSNGGPSVALFDLAAGRFRFGWTFPPAPRRGCGGTGKGPYHGPTKFAPDGSFVTSWMEEGFIILWDPVTGEPERLIETGRNGLGYRAFSPDGLWLATALENQVSLWDVPTGQHLVTRELPNDATTTGLSFAGPGRLLTTRSDLTILLWDVSPKKKPAGPLWESLIGDDARAANQAIWALAADPQGAEILRKKITPARPVPAQQVSRWLADLNSGRYKVREIAAAELSDLGRLVEPELRAAREKASSEEVRTRLDRLLTQIPRMRTPDEWVQARAVAALELAGTDAARKLLTEWAAGAPGARLTIDAKAALGRLNVKR